jgi:hypothetical protein
MAVEVAVVPPGHRPAIADPRSGLPAAWEEVARLEGVDVLRRPWPAPFAFAVASAGVDALEAPDLEYRTVEESYIRDELTRRYAALATGTTATPARITSVSPTTLELAVPHVPANSLLLVSENWDTAWRASAAGRNLPVRRAGPNLLAVDLEGLAPAAAGGIELQLTHATPGTWWGGGAVALLTLPAMFAALRWAPAPASGRRRRRADAGVTVE